MKTFEENFNVSEVFFTNFHRKSMRFVILLYNPETLHVDFWGILYIRSTKMINTHLEFEELIIDPYGWKIW